MYTPYTYMYTYITLRSTVAEKGHPILPSYANFHPSVLSYFYPSILTFFHTSILPFQPRGRVFNAHVRGLLLRMSRSTFLPLRNSSASPPGSREELIKLHFFEGYEYRLICFVCMIIFLNMLVEIVFDFVSCT